jgi:uncharacterized protein (DUF2249 family)
MPGCIAAAFCVDRYHEYLAGLNLPVERMRAKMFNRPEVTPPTAPMNRQRLKARQPRDEKAIKRREKMRTSVFSVECEDDCGNDDDEEYIEPITAADIAFEARDSEEEVSDYQDTDSEDTNDDGNEPVVVSDDDPHDLEARLRQEDAEHAESDDDACLDGPREVQVEVGANRAVLDLGFASDDEIGLVEEVLQTIEGGAEVLKGLTRFDLQEISRMRRYVTPSSISVAQDDFSSRTVKQIYVTLLDTKMSAIHQLSRTKATDTHAQLRAFFTYKTPFVGADDMQNHILAYRTWYTTREILRLKLLGLNSTNGPLCKFLEDIVSKPLLDYPLLNLNEDAPRGVNRCLFTGKRDVVGFEFLDGATQDTVAILWYDKHSDIWGEFALSFVRFWFLPWHIQEVVDKTLRPLWQPTSTNLESNAARTNYYNEALLPVVYDHVRFMCRLFERLLVSASIECGENVSLPLILPASS